jgi:hypothetical protein
MVGKIEQDAAECQDPAFEIAPVNQFLVFHALLSITLIFALLEAGFILISGSPGKTGLFVH